MKNIKEEFIDPELQLEFTSLKDKWINETLIVSDPTELYSNENYQKIISLGDDIIPLLIKDMYNFKGDWSYALKKITGDNPVKKESKGKIDEIKKDWIDWYEARLRKN